jgi:hypothetical protein
MLRIRNNGFNILKFHLKAKPVVSSTVKSQPESREKLLFLSTWSSFHCSGLRLQLADVTESHRGERLLVTLTKDKKIRTKIYDL